MNPVWKVTAMKMGELPVEKSMMTYLKDPGQQITIPMWSFAISGGSVNIVVDTGVVDIRKDQTPCKVEADETMIAALKIATGWDPEDVDIVINTHLHHDHIGNNNLFTNASLIVQKKEWETAWNPIPTQRSLYFQELIHPDRVNYLQWRFVEGEYEAAPGVRVFPTPGHSAGHQSVLVNTKDGVLCIAGDVVDLLENIEQNIPSGFLTSTIDWFDSIEQIRRRASFVLPGHEPGIQKFQNDHFPSIPRHTFK